MIGTATAEPASTISMELAPLRSAGGLPISPRSRRPNQNHSKLISMPAPVAKNTAL